MFSKIIKFFDQKTNIYFCLLFSILITLLQNGDGLFKFIYLTQILFIIFFIKIKLNPLRAFFNIGAILIIFLFSPVIESYQILFCNILILFSLDYVNNNNKKNDNRVKNKLIFLSFIIFLIFLLNFLSPHTDHYKVKYKPKFSLFDNSQEKQNKIFHAYSKILIKIINDNDNDKVNNDKVNSEFTFDVDKWIPTITTIFKGSNNHDRRDLVINTLKSMSASDEKIKKVAEMLNEMNRFLFEGYHIKTNLQKKTFIPILCSYLECKKSIVSINTRFTMKNLDTNYVALLLFTVLLILVTELKKKKNQIALFTIFLFIIIYYTKSRLGIVVSLAYFIYFFANKYFTTKNIAVAYIIGNLLLILLGYWMVNSLIDPNNELESMQLLPGSFLPYHEGEYFNQLSRLKEIFESSSYIRFLNYFKGYWLIINNIDLLWLPGNWETLSEYSYQTLNKTIMIISPKNAFPHNLLLGSIKEFGIICTIILHINMFYFLRYNKFKSVLIPVLAGSVFLGIQILFILHLLFIFSFIKRNNLLKLKSAEI